MNAGVPVTWVEVVMASRARAMPKSMSTGPSGPRITLAGLTSRCTIPVRWIEASAVSVLIARRCSPPPVRGPSSRTMMSSDGPGTYSLTRYGWSPSMPVPISRAVQNGATLAATWASRRNRRRASGSAAAPWCSTLIATRPWTGDSAR